MKVRPCYCVVNLNKVPLLKEFNDTYFWDGSNFHVLGSVRFDNSDELKDLFNCNDKTNDLELLLFCWLRWQDKCLNFIRGDFSFIIIDRQKKKVFGARDHFGVRPFFYAHSSDTLVFSNSLKQVLTLSESKELSKQWQLNYLQECKNSGRSLKIFSRTTRPEKL